MLRDSLGMVPASLLLSFAMFSFACDSPDRPSDVVVITVDSLRADRLGFAGHWRDTSPRLDELARESIVFESARSVAGWTLPSMASLFTGRRPRTHGARDFRTSIDREIPALPEILRDHGFETRGYVSHVLLDAHRGFDRGFDLFDESVLRAGNPHKVSTAEPLTDRVLADLDRRPVEKPLFLWVHYFDPHFDYVDHPGEANFGAPPSDRYDAEILHTDRQIGRLLAGLRERGHYEDALILFTADHGEEFGEHGGTLHETLHAEVVNVPLMIRVPGGKPGHSSTPARQIDIAPTVLAHLGIAPPAEWKGQSLFAAATTPAPAIFYERDAPTRFRQRGVRFGDYKLIVVESREPDPIDAALPTPGLAPGLFLYDIARDPRERHNLFRLDHPNFAPLLARLREHFEDPTLGVSVGAPADLAKPETSH